LILKNDVNDGDIGLQFMNCCQRFAVGSGFSAQRQVVCAGEQYAHSVTDNGMVVNDQNARRGRRISDCRFPIVDWQRGCHRESMATKNTKKE
jgi:hypothetical protein